MNPSKEIDNLVAQNPDWRGAMLSNVRQIILKVDPEIVEEWKYMGSPVWSRNGIICVGNIFKNKIQLVFASGAVLNDPDKLFNAGLEGNKRRVIDINEGDELKETALANLVLSAISYNLTREKR